MRIYVSGKFEEAPRVRAVMRTLEAHGHIITHDWTVSERDASPNLVASRDLAGVKDAHLLVVLMERDLPYEGAWAEIGAALVLNKPLYIIGPISLRQRQHPFLRHPLARDFQDFPDPEARMAVAWALLHTNHEQREAPPVSSLYQAEATA